MSWREELARREAGLDEEVARLRRQIDELTDQLAAAELALSRPAITRETMAELLAEDEPTGNGVPGEADVSANIVAAQPVSGSGRAFGVAGMDASAVLPGDYCDILAILAEAGNGLRAGQVAAELGITATDRSKVEALRSKLKRLVTRGWAAQAPSGVFTIAE
ncbi:hypothetical protein AB0E01_34755 [Nocardia vinacea]|uniref:hypothetical protein n=1 Tax=Nocardia vinacea TaxID=96468 RepID=UPI00340978CD